MSIINELAKISSDKVKRVFSELLQEYLSPSYGSISKKDFDILLFTKLQELDLVEANPSIYTVVTQFKLTRSKARNLLYEAKLRQSSQDSLEKELKQLLMSPIFLKEGDKIGIEIDNPYLTDYLRSKLKEMNHITDGSFSRELVRLTPEAFTSLIESYIDKQQQNLIKKEFIKLGLQPDMSFKGILFAILKTLGAKLADKTGEHIAESAANYLTPLINGNIPELTKRFNGFFG
ncbi:MAG: hypothetical protein OHK0012_17650 [Synechococcales cyanobacterium]